MGDEITYMQVALEEARFALARGEAPVGAVVVSPKGRIIAAAGNSVRLNRDVTAHAVLNAIRAAADILDSETLNGCDLFVTIEPCAMCAKAIAYAEIKRLYYSIDDAGRGGISVGARVFEHATTPHVPKVHKGLLADEARRLFPIAPDCD